MIGIMKKTGICQKFICQAHEKKLFGNAVNVVMSGRLSFEVEIKGMVVLSVIIRRKSKVDALL